MRLKLNWGYTEINNNFNVKYVNINILCENGFFQ